MYLDCLVTHDLDPIFNDTREVVVADVQLNNYPETYRVILGDTLQDMSIPEYIEKFG